MLEALPDKWLIIRSGMLSAAVCERPIEAAEWRSRSMRLEVIITLTLFIGSLALSATAVSSCNSLSHTLKADRSLAVVK